MMKLVPVLYYRAKTKQISGMAWSPDGQHLALISRQDHCLEILQSQTARQISHSVYGMSINTAVWSPETTVLVLGGEGALGEAESTIIHRGRSGVLVLDVHTHHVIGTLPIPETVTALAWSADNTFLSIAARAVTVWAVEQKKVISTIEVKDGGVPRYVGWLQDSRHLLIAWETRGQEIERTLTIHEAVTGKHISSIEVDTYPGKHTAPLQSDLAIRSLAMAPLGNLLAVSGVCTAVEDDPEAPLLGTINLIDLATGEQRQLAAGIFGRIRWGPFTESISWSHDARFLTASGWLQDSGRLIIIDVRTGQVVVDFTIEGERFESIEKQSSCAVRALAWSPVDSRLAIAAAEGCRIYRVQE